MPSNLKEYLIEILEEKESIPIHDYMALCLQHPEFGYYQKKEALGRKGDFITAPEISQSFGEIIGSYCAYIWQILGEPSQFHLIELGGGYGTLMSDILHVIKKYPAMMESFHIHMVETSPVMIARQKKAFEKYDLPIFWHKDLDQLPKDAPCMFLGNEFFDALPVRQLQKEGGFWYERHMQLNKQNEFEFCLGNRPVCPPETHLLADDAKDGHMIEYSPLSLKFLDQMARHLQKQTGVGLFMDYGYIFPTFGESLQAIKNHEYVDIFAYPGESDLTAHVDFGALGQVIGGYSKELKLLPPMSQGDFLLQLGIMQRGEALKASLSSQEEKDLLDSAIHRLTDKDEMGGIFKIFAFGHRSLKLPFDWEDQILAQTQGRGDEK